jgi:hypothetical protein
MVEASSKLNLLILFCYYFSGDHELTWESSSPAEAFSSVRLCTVCATVYVQNIYPVDRDIFWLYYARVSRNLRAYFGTLQLIRRVRLWGLFVLLFSCYCR